MLSMSPKKVVSVLTLFCKTYPDLPLVSIGSGMGIIERATSANVKNEFILVDPAPNSFFKLDYFDEVVAKYGLAPHYPYTKDLVLARPELASSPAGCILLLNWCSHGDDDYDLQALRLLRPRAVFAIVEVTGSAGSKQFHAYLKEDTTLYKPFCVYQVADPGKEKYPCSHVSISMQWLVPVTEAPPEPHRRSIVCLQKHDDTNQRNLSILKLDKTISQGNALLNRREELALQHEAKKKQDALDVLTSLVSDMFSMLPQVEEK